MSLQLSSTDPDDLYYRDRLLETIEIINNQTQETQEIAGGVNSKQTVKF